jgi:MFS family permease
MNSMFRSLRIRNYRIYASGAFVSNIGTWLQATAQAWLVLVLTHSGSLLGVVVALQLLPSLLFSVYAGVLADRLVKRSWLAFLQLAMAVPAGVLGVLAILGHAQVWQVMALTFIFGVARAFEAPVRQSYVAEMVPAGDLHNAVALNSASFNSARLVGPALAGLLIAALGSGAVATGWVITLNAVSYLFVMGSLFVQRRSELVPSPAASRGRGAIREGLAYVRSRPDLFVTLSAVFFLGAFGMNFQITSALMATEVFGRGAGEFGILGSVLAIGSLTGALLAARRARPRLRVVIVGAMAFALVQIVSAVMPTFWTYAATLPFIGVSLLSAMTTANSAVQTTSTPNMRGRVASLYLMVFLGSAPIGAPVIGWLGENIGPRWAVAISGIGVGIGVGAVTLWYLYLLRRRATCEVSAPQELAASCVA